MFAQEIAANSLYKDNGLWGVGTANKPMTPAVYDTLISIENTPFLIAKKHRANGQINNTGVVSFKGKTIIPHEYLNINPYSNGLVVTQWVNGETRFGVLSFANEIILNTRFKNISPIQNLWLATAQTNELNLYNLKGEPLATFMADSVSEAESPNYLYTYHNGKEGIISIHGLELSTPQYKSVSNNNGHWEAYAFPTWKIIQNSDTTQIKADSLRIWEDGYFVLGYKGNFHVERNGNRISNTYEAIFLSGDRLAATKNAERYGAIALDGKEILPTIYQKVAISSGYIYAKKENQWLLYDSLGGQRNVFTYDSIGESSEGLFPIKRKGKWGFMDRHGVETIHCIYDSLSTFRDDKAIITYFGKKGIINKQGEWEVKPICDDITSYSFDFYISRMSNQYYLKNYSGEIIYFSSKPIDDTSYSLINRNPEGLTQEYVEDSLFNQSTSKTKDWRIIYVDGKYGFEGQDGLLKVTYRYDSLLPFSEDLAAFKLRGRWGFIDRNEQIAVQPLFTNVTSFTNELSKVEQNGLFGLINTQGSYVLKPKYNNIKLLKDGVWQATENGKKGLYNHSGEVILHPFFDNISYVNNELIIVRKSNKYGIVNSKGSSILPRIYDYIGYDKDHEALLLKKNPERSVKIN